MWHDFAARFSLDFFDFNAHSHSVCWRCVGECRRFLRLFWFLPTTSKWWTHCFCSTDVIDLRLSILFGEMWQQIGVENAIRGFFCTAEKSSTRAIADVGWAFDDLSLNFVSSLENGCGSTLVQMIDSVGKLRPKTTCLFLAGNKNKNHQSFNDGNVNQSDRTLAHPKKNP